MKIELRLFKVTFSRSKCLILHHKLIATVFFNDMIIYDRFLHKQLQ